MTTDYKKTIFVTGAGSGMGLACAVFLAEKGYCVYGSVFNDEQATALGEEASRRGVKIGAVQMNLTREDQIEDAVQHLVKTSPPITALIQFAGMGLRGFFEDLDLEEIRQVYEVNVFGAMALTQAILPHMRNAGGGRIVIVSSVAGRTGSMSLSGYASSKFAVEGFAECLAQEVAPFGIYVSLLEPGLIKTPHFTTNRNRAKRAKDPNSLYYPWFCQHEKIVDDLLRRNRFTAGDVSQVVYKILQARHPKLRYMVGVKAQLVVSLRRHIPGELFERFYFRMVRRLVTSPKQQATSLS